MDTIKFMPNLENEEQYIYRICSTKESLGMTWRQIADVLNEALGHNYDESAYRKKVQSFNKIMKNHEDKFFTDDEYLKKIQEQTDELYKAKKQFQDQRREYNKILSQAARSEHLNEELIKAAQDLSSEKMLNGNKTVFIDNDNDALLILTDWHYGMVTDNIWNKYNISICKDRISKLLDKSKQYLRINNVDTLYVMVLGDLIHGSIHTSVRVASEEATCKQLMDASELLAELIDELSKYVNKVRVFSTYGNHARITEKKEDSIHSDNMEQIVPWWLTWRLKDNVKVIIEDNNFYEFLYADIKGHGVVGVHGDLDSFKKIGVDMHTLFTKQYGINVEYCYSGDKHHSESIDVYGIDNVLVSSLCGTDDYANNKRLFSKAGQTLCIFNSEDGKVCTYNITF